MPFPTPSTQDFCLSRSSCSFLQRRAPSFQPAFAQEAQPFTLIALHFATYVERIRINILLIVMMCLAVRKGLEAGSRGKAPGEVSGDRCLGDSVEGPPKILFFFFAAEDDEL
jgi:hypothetical protein